MSPRRRALTIRFVAATAAALGIVGGAATVTTLPFGVGAHSASGATVSQLNAQLGSQRARQQSLAAALRSLDRLISSLDAQIALVQSREAAVGVALTRDRAALTVTQASLQRERTHLRLLRARLARARRLLSYQLVSSYESDKPDLVAVVLEARGFTDLLEKIDFLHRAEQQQQTIIAVTREAKAQADTASRRLTKLEASDRQIAEVTALRARALAGMNALLQSKQAALQQAQAAQQAALDASRARGRGLQAAISRLQAQQAAAQRAATQAAQAVSTGAALGPSGGWAIPYAIVLCESGGANLPPNTAGASGYYQIIPGTWRLFGGSGPAAYLSSKAEQDAVAARIWNGGAGASNWVCAGIVGIH